jgi:hypothetical protein
MYDVPQAPQSIGGVLDSGFRLYSAGFKRVFVLAAVSSLLSGVLQRTTQSAVLQPSPGTATVLAVALIAIALAIAVIALTGAIIGRVDAISRGADVSLSEALATGWRRGPALFGAWICYGLAVTVGFILLIVPGVILMVSMLFGNYAAVTERMGPIAALNYSRQIVRGHWWRTTALVTVIGVIVIVLYIVVLIIVGTVAAMTGASAAAAVGATPPWYAQLIVGPLLEALIAPLMYSMFMAIFNDLKLRHEGGDIAERIAAAQT